MPGADEGGERMPLQQLTPAQLNKVVFDSLHALWNFGSKPGDPQWENEQIAWSDILDVPPVTPTYLYTHTLVATHLLDPAHYVPVMNQKVFVDHVKSTARETVAQYITFLAPLLLVKMAS